MNNSFHIIAVRVLKGCKPYIRKVLKENTTYFLRNEYEYDDKTNMVRKKKDVKGIYDSFFDIASEKTNCLKINISAIVGKNGDGKSSLIELIIRILNNFAYASGFLQIANDLQPIEGVYGVLFYSIDDKIFSIECRNNNIIFKSTNITTDNYIDDIQHQAEFSLQNPNETINDFIKKYASVLFYTFVINYSLYAYNSKELNVENTKNKNCWINGIFHKNDGYQTPLVLHPFRKEGNININIENILNQQRLMAMFVDGSISEINKNEMPQRFTYKLEQESKLLLKSLKDYIKENHDLQDSLFEDFYKRISQLDKIDIKSELWQQHLSFWRIMNECMENNKFLFEAAKKFQNETDNNEFLLTSKINKKYGIDNYINLIRSNKKYNDSIAIPIINKFTQNNYNSLSFATLHRIAIINEIQKLWNQKFKKINISEWEYDIHNENNSPISHAKSFIIYKTIDILETYTTQYGDWFPILRVTSFPLMDNEYLEETQGIIHKAFDALFKDIESIKSHITLKIRQTFNFLKWNSKYNYLDIISNQKKEESFISFRQKINHIIEEENESNLKVIELLPPPIYELEVIIQKEKESVQLSSLSSGEHQLLNSISSIAYHLRNIDSSIETDNTIGYNFVNIILEEIELYFHPEFQQKFIITLLNILSKMEFKRLRAVNICFITHSPYILSDIPKNNVLFLENGTPVFPMQEDTFASNIHTLLHNGFFLSNIPIGIFAKHKINTLFEKLYKGQATQEIHDEILLVSEPILRAQLIKLYKQNIALMDNEFEKLKNEIEILKNQLEKIKNEYKS